VALDPSGALGRVVLSCRTRKSICDEVDVIEFAACDGHDEVVRLVVGQRQTMSVHPTNSSTAVHEGALSETTTVRVDRLTHEAVKDADLGYVTHGGEQVREGQGPRERFAGVRSSHDGRRLVIG
jgi:hypothetical protein